MELLPIRIYDDLMLLIHLHQVYSRMRPKPSLRRVKEVLREIMEEDDWCVLRPLIQQAPHQFAGDVSSSPSSSSTLSSLLLSLMR